MDDVGCGMGFRGTIGDYLLGMYLLPIKPQNLINFTFSFSNSLNSTCCRILFSVSYVFSLSKRIPKEHNGTNVSWQENRFKWVTNCHFCIFHFFIHSNSRISVVFMFCYFLFDFHICFLLIL